MQKQNLKKSFFTPKIIQLWLKGKLAFQKSKFLYLIAFPSLLAAVFYIGNFALAQNSITSFVSTLVTAQVSLLSIVFALLILGFNLISDKYGVRANQLIRKNPLFWLTGTVFLTSVSLNLIALMTIDGTLGRLWLSLLGLSIGMSINSVSLLFLFVNSALKQTQPKEILELIEQDNQPKMVINKMRDRQERINDSISVHPLYPLHRMALNSLERGDLATGKLAVRKMEKISKDVIKEMDGIEDKDGDLDELAQSFIKPITNDLLPSISYDYNGEDTETSYECIQAIRKINEELVVGGKISLISSTSIGLDDILRKGLREEKEYTKLVNHSMKQRLEFIDFIVNEWGFNSENDKHVRAVNHQIKKIEKIGQYPIRSDTTSYRLSYQDLFRKYPNILEGVLSTIYKPASKKFRWHNWEDVSFDEEAVDIHLDLISTVLDVAQTSIGKVISYKDHNDRYPMPAGNFYRFLENITRFDDNLTIDSRRALWVMSLELSAQYYEKWNEEFTNHIFRILRDSGKKDQNIMNKSFEEAIEYSKSGQKMYFFNHKNNHLCATPEGRKYFRQENIFSSDSGFLKVPKQLRDNKTYYDNWLKDFQSELNDKIKE